MMPGPWQLLIILAVVLLLVGGGGKITKLMHDMGSGITAFKKGLKTENDTEDGVGDAAPAAIEGPGDPRPSASWREPEPRETTR